MRLILFVNNWVALQLTRWLRESGEEIAGVVVHTRGKSLYREEIIHAAGVADSAVIDGAVLREPHAIRQLADMKADLGVSIGFGYILKDPVIQLFSMGLINLHPSLLPYNRGAYPNVWSIVDRTPAGVTLHYVDHGIDTGDIISQREVPTELTDTGETLYRKLEKASVDLFQQAWPAFRRGDVMRRSQLQGGSYHKVKDVAGIDAIDLNQVYVARDLLDVIRARTFPPHRGAYFVDERGERVYLRLSLLREDEI